ncbi:hypothetical protein ASwh1_414 [Aeromonas phage Aswh_1]|nr:hypothetical protein ASwh1_414 [Aeromonas phage Aswh_1]
MKNIDYLEETGKLSEELISCFRRFGLGNHASPSNIWERNKSGYIAHHTIPPVLYVSFYNDRDKFIEFAEENEIEFVECLKFRWGSFNMNDSLNDIERMKKPSSSSNAVHVYQYKKEKFAVRFDTYAIDPVEICKQIETNKKNVVDRFIKKCRGMVK